MILWYDALAAIEKSFASKNDAVMAGYVVGLLTGGSATRVNADQLRHAFEVHGLMQDEILAFLTQVKRV